MGLFLAYGERIGEIWGYHSRDTRHWEYRSGHVIESCHQLGGIFGAPFGGRVRSTSQHDKRRDVHGYFQWRLQGVDHRDHLSDHLH